LGVGSVHPNAAFHLVAQQNQAPAIQANTQGRITSPFRTGGALPPAPVVQPHERNRLETRKVRRIYHTVGGASHVIRSDTAFKRIPPKQKAPAPIAPQTDVLRVPDGQKISFASNGNQWYDPNQSFNAGVPNVYAGSLGRGRWQIVKRGAAG
jgi:hypothetical protein